MAGKKDYDRYSLLKNNDGTMNMMPFVRLPERSSDKYERWNSETSRLDKLAKKYYGNPFYDFLILYANPSYLSPYDFPDGCILRIPFPLAQAKSDYESRLNQTINQ